MELRTHGLALTLEFSRPDDEGWMRCDVTVQVPGFSGAYQCDVWRPDMKSFHKELARMVKQIGQPCSASLVTTDPGIELHLNMNRVGQIEGRYELRNFRSNGPSLSGVFEMDQSYLPGLIEDVKNSVK